MVSLNIKLAMLSTAVMMYTCHPITGSNPLHPLILVPGNGGNQLEARLTAEYKPTSLFCTRRHPARKDEDGWFRLWFDLSVLLAPYTQCFAHRMTLHYDAVLDDYRNTPGVETRVPHFGSTESLLYLNPRLKKITTYMESLVKSLEQIGYIDGKNLFGAPYDFRYGLAAEGHPCHVGSKLLQDLKILIEKASTSNEGKPVILVSHSLGGLFVLQLLNRNSPSWRQKYIKHFVALSAPWGGTVEEMLTFASGYSLGVPLVDPLLVREEQRSSESNLWLMPTPKAFGYKPLVITPNVTYTSQDIPQFLNDIGFQEGKIRYKSRILPLVEQLKAPEVPITCIIGTGVETPETLFYGEGGFDKQPEVVFGDGDGSVNMASLVAIESEWADEKNQTLKFIRVPGVSHTDILKDDDALGEIIGEICSINSQLVKIDFRMNSFTNEMIM
ncbi:Lecithin-cholesterol acyltransferase-like [Actinidia chinensis var. chinensis]|uniref:Lecithin-cholesterol acyltransferase-like n=1 Tax=Actinidia chinensis var. chinensis TaxID=1590841 RepID=A0A2R6Q0I5_ACTCC|nr:Lecithin-cholesterol acyltransferase-like [Actinidia chinensis var. chinensis]